MEIISSKSNLVEELAQFFSHRCEGKLHVLLTVRPAKVGAEDHRPGEWGCKLIICCLLVAIRIPMTVTTTMTSVVVVVILGAILQAIGDTGQGRHDPRVVGDLPILLGHVEVAPVESESEKNIIKVGNICH